MTKYEIFINSFHTELVITLYLLFSLTNAALAQTSLITSLNENLIQLESMEQTEEFASFDKFSKVLINTKILGMGEETHGIKEFTDFGLM